MASGSFGSLNTALTALQYQRVQMDVASSNIANASTEGYARRKVDGLTLGAPAVPAMWSRYVGTGEGVLASDSQRMVDELLNGRSRLENSNLSYLDTRQAALERIEAGIAEPTDKGVAQALQDFRTAWQDLANNPAGDAQRSQVRARGENLAQAFATQARNLDVEASDNRYRVVVDVANINQLASDLAATNKAITAAAAVGTDHNVLLDQRDVLAQKLATLTGGVASVQSDGTFNFSVSGVALVSGGVAGQVQIAGGIDPVTGAGVVVPGDPLAVPPTYDADQAVTFQIDLGGSVTAIPTAPDGAGMPGGELGGLTELLNTTIPSYKADLNAIVAGIAADVNALHTSGFDADGNPGGAFFGFADPNNPASTLLVAVATNAGVAASQVAGALGNDIAVAIGSRLAAEDSYQRYVNTMGTDVASVKRLAYNQYALTTQVDNTREQLSGVNLDEEMNNLVVAQRSYEAAARVLSAVDEMLDTLINRTGLVGR